MKKIALIISLLLVIISCRSVPKGVFEEMVAPDFIDVESSEVKKKKVWIGRNKKVYNLDRDYDVENSYSTSYLIIEKNLRFNTFYVDGGYVVELVDSTNKIIESRGYEIYESEINRNDMLLRPIEDSVETAPQIIIDKASN